MWAAGDYPERRRRASTARLSAALLAALPYLAGREVLDVATGTGNAASASLGRRAARAYRPGPRRRAARRRPPAARRPRPGGSIDWIAGDAEALPFGDAAFDVGHLGRRHPVRAAPPDHRRRAACASCARAGRSAWSTGRPAGLIGRMFGVLGQPHAASRRRSCRRRRAGAIPTTSARCSATGVADLAFTTRHEPLELPVAGGLRDVLRGEVRPVHRRPRPSSAPRAGPRPATGLA